MLSLAFKEDCPTPAEHSLRRGPGAARRICMVTHSFYESDNRIIRYAEALTERGDQVEVVALRRSAQMLRRELVNGVLVHRIQDRFGKDEASPWSYLWP